MFNLIGLVLAGFVTVVGGMFIASVLINPFLPQLRLKPQKSDIPPLVPERPALSKKEASLRQASEKINDEKVLREETRRDAP